MLSTIFGIHCFKVLEKYLLASYASSHGRKSTARYSILFFLYSIDSVLELVSES